MLYAIIILSILVVILLLCIGVLLYGMKNVNVNIEVTYDNDDEFTATGRDSVEFLIKTNLGGEYLPLAKIASGGEMSRVMLAIKTVFLKSYNISTVVFDEIDVGISGMAATKVAKKMEKLSKEAQVICVTHLANVAALADNNLYIYKENLNNKETATRIKKLSGEEKIKTKSLKLYQKTILKNIIYYH